MRKLLAPERLLKKLGVAKPCEIDLEAIAFYVGVIVHYRPLQGCEARIVGTTDKAIISVNDSSNQTRQRFSIAHELGHWHYDKGKVRLCQSEDMKKISVKSDNPEWRANQYAANLLMPYYLFQPEVEQRKQVSFKTIKEISQTFKTSLTATAITITQHGMEPIVLICHTKEGIKWHNRSIGIANEWYLTKEINYNSGAFGMAFGQDGAGHRKLVKADTWFNKRSAQNHQIYEETIKISDNQFLTLLTFKDKSIL